MSVAHVGAGQGTDERRQLVAMVTGDEGFESDLQATGALNVLLGTVRNAARNEMPVKVLHLGYRLLEIATKIGAPARELLMRMLTRAATHARGAASKLELTPVKIDGSPAYELKILPA